MKHPTDCRIFLDTSVAAEHAEMCYNCIICTGAAADFQQATAVATSMVKRFGMSEKVILLLLVYNQCRIVPDLFYVCYLEVQLHNISNSLSDKFV